ncbi:MAG: TatD family hydrolase [Ornithinimicrobium sp.]
MSRALPPLDLHAHIDPTIEPRELESLGAVVFAATRSTEEFERTRRRSDAVTVWGLGCHPGVASAQSSYNEAQFAALLARTPLVSEVGLDGSSRVRMQRQVEVFASILALLRQTPRLVSVHSARATKSTLEVIEQSAARGVILHWWLGSDAETRRAVELGCLFSVNRSMDVVRLKAAGVPITSLLPETDHPSGNRGTDKPQQPGWTLDVELTIALAYGTTPEEVRLQFWRTLVGQVGELGLLSLLPPVVQAMLAHARVR